MKNKDIKIMIATHKKYKMPKDDIYLPVHVGKKGKEDLGYIGDDTGNNISEKNPFYCELTAMFWGWKNLHCEYIGLVHYRRHFKSKAENRDKFENILDKNSIENLLEKTKIILPKKRKYYIESIYDHYMHTHYEKDLVETRKVIEEICPTYLNDFDKCMKRKEAHMFNMFIMEKSLFNEYCEFLFKILFELEKRIDISKYDIFQARLFGRISELLLDVWLEKNNYAYLENKVMHMEKINWLKKGRSFLMAKFFNKKYKGSF